MPRSQRREFACGDVDLVKAEAIDTARSTEVGERTGAEIVESVDPVTLAQQALHQM